MAINQAKVLTITSVKGGTGKTTNVLNLAGIFSSMKKKVLIIDLDLHTGSIAASMNLKYEKDIYNLFEDLSNNRFDNLENYISKYNEYISVLPAPKDPRVANKINSKFIDLVLYKSKMQYDVILIDTNHILNEINLCAFDYSDEIVYILSNDPMDLKNMRTMVSIFNDMGKSNYKIVLYEAIDKNRNYFNKFDIKNIIEKNINYTIPSSFYLKNIDSYIMNGKILTLDKRIRNHNKKAIKNYNMIATSLIKE